MTTSERIRRRTRAGSPASALLLAVFASACDIPTDLPIIDSRWIVPAEETRFGVAELLPDNDVTVSPDSTTFIVDFDPVAFSTTLGGLCAACAAADGLTVPKPPFTGTVESAVDFPPEVFGVTVVSGQVALEVTNNFGFDPLRPASGSNGTMTLRVTDNADGDLLAELVVDGVATPFPDGMTIIRNLALAPTVVNDGLLATVIIDSPLGDPVTVDANALLAVNATASDVRVSAVSADVSGKMVPFDPVDLGLEDVDAEVQEIVREGAFVLHVTNPFGIGADFDLTIDGPTIAALQRSATIPPDAESTVTLLFTGAEIQSFLGEPGVLLTGGATVSAAAGIVSLAPGEELVLDAELDLVLRINGGGN